jgi:hypothetical protein
MALRYLNVNADDSSGDTLGELEDLTDLRSLILGGNFVRGEDIAKLKELKSLRELCTSSARFADGDWKHLGELANLGSLKIRRASGD